MNRLWILVGTLCVACPPPAMNPTPDPLPPPGASGAPASTTSAAVSRSDGAAPVASGTPRADLPPPPLSSPNPTVDGGTSGDAAAVVTAAKTDEEALRALGERAQACAGEKRIALPPSEPLWVRMMLKVEPDGSVSELRLSSTSGLSDLDTCATAAAKAARFPPRDSATWLEAPIGFRAAAEK